MLKTITDEKDLRRLQIECWILFWLFYIAMIAYIRHKTAGGFCANCMFMSTRQYYFYFAWPLLIAYLPYFYFHKKHAGNNLPFLHLLPLIGIVLIGLESVILCGVMYRHGSSYEMIGSVLGRIFWMMFLILGALNRPLGGKPVLEKWYMIITSAAIHLFALWHMTLEISWWLQLDLGFQSYVRKIF